MKTTIEIPDELFRATKARAAHRGESLKTFVCDALQARLDQESAGRSSPAWRKVFGRVESSALLEIDAVIESEFEQVDPSAWE